MSYTPVKPLPTRKELLSKELGLNCKFSSSWRVCI